MSRASEAKFVGVDWAKGGWFSVGFDEVGNWGSAFGKFEYLVEHYSRAELILVDIPIGLAPGKYEWRECDQEAKECLNAPSVNRSSSVFLTPHRYVVEAAREAKADAVTPRDFQGALEQINALRPRGTKFSSQAWNITPMIAEVDGFMMSRTPEARPQVREVHPEICFWALNDDQPMQWSKKKPEGQAERVRILQSFEPRTPEILDAALADPGSHAAEDDILDALAAAVTARLGYPDRLATLPASPPRDARGLPDGDGVLQSSPMSEPGLDERLEYCAQCGYLPRAQWMAGEILAALQDDIACLSLVPRWWRQL